MTSGNGPPLPSMDWLLGFHGPCSAHTNGRCGCQSRGALTIHRSGSKWSFISQRQVAA